jgi:hypothetical protein
MTMNIYLKIHLKDPSTLQKVLAAIIKQTEQCIWVSVSSSILSLIHLSECHTVRSRPFSFIVKWVSHVWTCHSDFHTREARFFVFLFSCSAGC